MVTRSEVGPCLLVAAEQCTMKHTVSWLTEIAKQRAAIGLNCGPVERQSLAAGMGTWALAAAPRLNLI